MIVAHWYVLGADVLADRALLRSLEQAAEGELRLAASREDAETVGAPRRTEIRLYNVDTEDDDGQPTRRLETAAFLTILGQEVPATPDAVVFRWEQDARRRPWPNRTRRG